MSDIDFDKVIEIANEKLEISEVKEEEIIARCPWCGDSKTKPYARRLIINYYPVYETYIAHCWRCGESQNIISFYSYLYDVSYIEAKKNLCNNVYNPEKIINKLNKNNTSQTSRKSENKNTEFDIDFEKECLSRNSSPNGRQEKRYVELLKKFENKRGIEGCLVAVEGKYKGRIIIPIYKNGEIIYFQGRSLFDDMYPKYLNPEVDKEHIIINEEKFRSDLPIIISEGIIDVKMVGDQGTTNLGASITDNFIEKVDKYTEEYIILALDNFRKDSASYKVFKKILENSRFSKKVRYFIFPGEYKDAKDLNDIVKDYDVPKDKIFDIVINNSYSWLKMEKEIKLER